MVLKNLFYSLLFLFIGISLGIVWANRSIQAVGQNKSLTLKNAEWSYFAAMDLAKNDLQRAFIGRIGLFALKDSEAIYFIANQDQDGNPLHANNSYILEGSSFDAAYWSITLYGEDHFLMSNKEDRYSYNQVNINYNDSLKQHYTIQLGGQEKHQKNYLPTEGEQQINLLLRIYKPSKALYSNRDKVKLPTIKRVNL